MQNVARIGGDAPSVATLNERIQQSISLLERDLDRLGGVLVRAGLVEPSPPQPGASTGVAVPVSPLSAAVDYLDALSQRLSNLIASAERIA